MAGGGFNPFWESQNEPAEYCSTLAESQKIPPNFFCFAFGALMRSFTPSVRVQKGGESPMSLISPPKYEEEAKQNFKIKTKTKIQNRARARERERQIPPLAMRDEPPARQNERRGRNYTILCLLGLLSFSHSHNRLVVCCPMEERSPAATIW